MSCRKVLRNREILINDSVSHEDDSADYFDVENNSKLDLTLQKSFSSSDIPLLSQLSQDNETLRENLQTKDLDNLLLENFVMKREETVEKLKEVVACYKKKLNALHLLNLNLEKKIESLEKSAQLTNTQINICPAKPITVDASTDMHHFPEIEVVRSSECLGAQVKCDVVCDKCGNDSSLWLSDNDMFKYIETLKQKYGRDDLLIFDPLISTIVAIDYEASVKHLNALNICDKKYLLFIINNSSQHELDTGQPYFSAVKVTTFIISTPWPTSTWIQLFK